jgi:sulfite oxidase
LLQHCGINLNDDKIKHVKFEGLDKDPITGTVYGASIPKEKAFDEMGDVLIAFKMNGVDIPLDFGFPIRVIVPGVIGARSVKWLKKISLSEDESKSFWQTNDYKVLPPSVKNLKEADFSKYHATQEMPVQSAICEPVNGAIVEKSDSSFTIKGYVSYRKILKYLK